VAVLLVVVSRSEPSRVKYLTHVFANKTADVVLDRRVEERRPGWLRDFPTRAFASPRE
jgi:hypothetical protein